jgi:hypothetical protein
MTVVPEWHILLLSALCVNKDNLDRRANSSRCQGTRTFMLHRANYYTLNRCQASSPDYCPHVNSRSLWGQAAMLQARMARHMQCGLICNVLLCMWSTCTNTVELKIKAPTQRADCAAPCKRSSWLAQAALLQADANPPLPDVPLRGLLK